VAIDLLRTEADRSGVTVTIESEGAPAAVVDDDWFAIAARAALAAMLAFVQGVGHAAVLVRVSLAANGGAATVELSQRTGRVPPPAFARFFDETWTDRPGGYQAAVEAATLRRLVTRHGGRTEFVPADGGGCRLLVVLPAVR
jgi:hypothetical protein